MLTVRRPRYSAGFYPTGFRDPETRYWVPARTAIACGRIEIGGQIGQAMLPSLSVSSWFSR